MKKLKAAGLFGGELVRVTGSLAARYNECLALLGVAPTTLTDFSIDAMGWSPEISEEKSEKYYLNTGDANTNAIILTPQQHGKPVHMPSHSFDRDLMNAVFVAHEKTIRDITKDSAICVNLDQKIDAFYEAFDLLRYDTIVVNFKILNELDKKQKEQEQLVEEFLEGSNFIDRSLHKKLLSFAKTYGDLRKRKLSLEPLSLKVSSFYTRSFGGVFVLKDFIKDIMIFESKETFNQAIKNDSVDVMLFHIEHDELFETLTSHLILEEDIKKSVKTARHERIKRHIFSRHIENPEHSFKEILSSHFLFQRYLNELDPVIQKKITGVEMYYQKKIIDKTLKLEDFVDINFSKSLRQPHSSLQEEQKDLIWKLLSKIAPVDPVHLYWYDKAAFYEAYQTWNSGYKDWVIERILINNQKAGV